MEKLNLKKLLFISPFLFLFLSIRCIPGVLCRTSLSDSGGYTFSIGFENSIPSPTNVEGFLEELKGTIQIFSENLHKSSQGVFYVENVNFNIPQHWNYNPEETLNFTAESFHSCDLKVSKSASYPYVHNLNPCGASGAYIELPLSILDSTFVDPEESTQDYGTPWKVILNQWARYRWGVHPEHGTPKHETFPYLYQKFNSDEWEVTTCSNKDIVGTYLNQYNEPCNRSNIHPPSSSCRFIPSDEPDDNSDVTSSLMAFHWIDTITEFCDDSTHISDAPNPQNFYCKHKSIMEVMHSTEDYLSVTNPLSSVPEVQVNIKLVTSKPMVYVLVDNDFTATIPSAVHNAIKTNLINLYSNDNEDLWSGVLSTLKTFSPNLDSTFLETLASWDEVNSGHEEFVKAISDLKFDNKSPTDFTRSINQAVEEIMSFKHEEGVILFIIKIGTERDGYFGNALYEEELVLKLSRQNIYIIGMELLENQIMFSSNLKRIAMEYGEYHSISKLDDLNLVMQMIDANIQEILSDSTGVVNPSKSEPIYASYIYAYDEATGFELAQDQYTKILLTLTSTTGITNVTLNGDFVNLQFKYEWMANELIDSSVRFAYFETFDVDSSMDSYWNITFECEDLEIDESECNVLLVVYGMKSSPLVVENELQIELETSARKGNGVTSIPLLIYASVQNGDLGIKGITSVSALVEDANNPLSNWRVKLVDDGKGQPDLVKDDGIYTGLFTPDFDYHMPGMHYKINIYAFHSGINQEEETLSTYTGWDLSHHSRILPVDQQNIQCMNSDCEAVFIDSGFNRVVKMKDSFSFIGDEAFNNFPLRTSDFSFKALDNYQIELTWTSPIVIGTSDSVSTTEIRRSKSIKALLNDFDSTDQVAVLSNAHIPGSTQIFTIDEELDEFYYAVRTKYNTQVSEVSNIIDVKPREKEIFPLPEINSYGYEITIGIDENTSIPEDIPGFLDSIYESIDALSEYIYRTTDGAFHIKSAPIVIPNKWILDVEEFSVKSYKTSDIRISSVINTPRAENPNACGVAGNFIEMPDWFFGGEGEAKYGVRWKTMLNLWARYRWGIWEEHGHTYSMEFPYFYKKPGQDFWNANSCFDQEIQGEYFNNVTGEICETNGDYAPGTDCRFYPSEETSSSSVKSSIMSFHWINSLTDFCDESTHNKESPNRQNKFCKHKSAMEIIKSVPEFGKGNLLDERPRLEKTIYKASNSPLFYILMDGGVNSLPLPAMQNITREISNLFDIGNLKDETLVKMSIFENEDYESSPVPVLSNWEAVKLVRDDLKRLIFNFHPIGSLKRSFAIALKQTIEEIISLRHKPGAVILMLKTGSSGSVFEHGPTEDEMNAILREHNINIYTIETRTNALNSLHLRNLSLNSNGRHLQLVNGVGIGSIKAAITTPLLIRLNNKIIGNVHRFMHREYFDAPYKEFPVKFYTHGLSAIYISFTTSLSVSNATISLSQAGSGSWNGIQEMHDWNEGFDDSRRKVYRGTYTTNPENFGEQLQLTLKFECQNTVPNCGTNTLIIYGETNSISEVSEIDSLEISVSTSALASRNNLDLMEWNQTNLVPFAIYAKIENPSATPIINIQSVNASLKHFASNTIYEIPMSDSGDSDIPDTLPHDGIYSAQFLPPLDGTYEISVKLSHNPGAKTSRLLPIDQNIICFNNAKCHGIEPREPYNRTVIYPHKLNVSHSSSEWTNRGLPIPILDLTAWALGDYNVSLSWTSPSGINYPATEPVSSYKLCIGSNLNEILEGNCVGFEEILETSPPGTKVNFIFSGEPNTVYYFGIITNHESEESSISNIVGIITRETELITTPITLPPVTTTPWTTTEEITEPPIPTKPPTSEPSSSTNSPPPSTTEETKYWFEKPEGYITLSVFGAVVLILIVGSITFLYLRNQSLTKRSLEQMLNRRESF